MRLHRHPLARELRRLDRLGSPGAVADALRAAGVRGERSRASRCPLAVYLTERTGATTEVGVSLAVWAGTLESRRLPANVAAFRERFDARCYPSLEARP